MSYAPRTYEQFVKQFWGQVDKSSEDDCWNWLGPAVNGYGVTFCAGKNLKAHRVASELTDGPIPPGINICHRCDNRRCCNPKHLFRGSQADNIADMIAKGRQNFQGAKGIRRSGIKNGRAKLTPEQVEEIRATARRWGRPRGISHAALAEKFGVGTSTISAVLSRRNWKEVP